MKPLTTEQLARRANLSGIGFETTDQIEPVEGMIGQERALDALRLGSGIRAAGFNLFVIGPPEVGLERAVRTLVGQQAAAMAVPSDWAYVHNFSTPRCPRVLQLPPGCAPKLKKAIGDLIADLGVALPAAFDGQDYEARRSALDAEFRKKQDEAFSTLAQEAAASSATIVRTPVGFAVAPLREGQVLKPDEFNALDEGERDRIHEILQGLERKLERVLAAIPGWDKERREGIRRLDRETARSAVKHTIEDTKNAFPDLPQVLEHIDLLETHLVDNAGAFTAAAAAEDSERKSVIRQAGNFELFEINVFVTSAGQPSGAPLVEELHPTLGNLVGRIEHQWQEGVLSTDFRQIKAGALHRANGGYLVLDARSLLIEPFSYLALKRALKTHLIKIDSIDQMIGLISTQPLEPEPIPLEVKVILIGDRMLYYLLWAFDPELATHFKVLADFDEALDRGAGAERNFVGLIASLLRRERFQALDRGAAECVIEHAARVAEDAGKLTLQVDRIRDLLAEADYWASEAGSTVTTRASVERAIREKDRRASRVRDRLMESTLKGVALIATQGSDVGQVNGLSVLGLGDFTFGRPTRITARVHPGTGRVLDIEREVELGGPIHSKGVLILAGFLAGRYALDAPISMQASLVFEQSYGGVEGDSASSAELYALLSALAQVPLRQDLAVTGSVNQYGQVQAIGGVNEKIEGFFDLCRERGLTGTQGVLIPASNVQHLMLRAEVIEACDQGRFAVFPVANIDQGVELLTGIEAGERGAAGEFAPESVNARVEVRLRAFAKARRRQAADAAEAGK
ncbi:Peptidase S16, lon-like protein [Burkholderiales bacterium]|nr:Peptidase S16, lon-like protein [Burkholderiales bacterium]